MFINKSSHEYLTFLVTQRPKIFRFGQNQSQIGNTIGSVKCGYGTHLLSTPSLVSVVHCGRLAAAAAGSQSIESRRGVDCKTNTLQSHVCCHRSFRLGAPFLLGPTAIVIIILYLSVLRDYWNVNELFRLPVNSITKSILSMLLSLRCLASEMDGNRGINQITEFYLLI